jgi:predicted enzyme related to lactoylglutathione lyase
MEVDKTPGVVTWMDLTVNDADGVRDFYRDVVGWKTMDINMGEYNDYCMMSPSDDQVRSGICHHRGSNTGIPPVWMMYINVTDLDDRMEKVKQLGGEIVHGPRKMGEKARYCIIRDPAGAYCALYDHG